LPSTISSPLLSQSQALLQQQTSVPFIPLSPLSIQHRTSLSSQPSHQR
jgi:hypothetical protein